MTEDHPERARVVVCGTIFGQIYLEALHQADRSFELAGILSRGSDRSRHCAEQYGVPLFTSIEQIPGDVSMACVIVRSALLGGQGTDLAARLMGRGIHVLQEHPLHYDELARCLREAHRHGVVYRLNPFYRHLRPVRFFIGAARELLRRQAPVYIDAACGFQVAYALFDTLAMCLGAVHPWQILEASPLHMSSPEGAGSGPFRSLACILGGVPLTVRIQNQLDPADPDNHAHLLHTITLGTESGHLTLVDSHGPVLWTPRPRFPTEVRSLGATPHFSSAESASSEFDMITTLLAAAPDADRQNVFARIWPEGVVHALRGLRDAALTREDPRRLGQLNLAICQVWQDVTARLGPPELVKSNLPHRLSAQDLGGIVQAGNTWALQ